MLPFKVNPDWNLITRTIVPVISAPVPVGDRTNGKWAIGPTAVALHIAKGDPWVYGALINNLGSVGGHGGNFPDVNQMLLQPFINYNFPDAPGRYLSFSPIITANWEATENKNGWVVPLGIGIGIGIGQIMKWGSQPVNLRGLHRSISEAGKIAPAHVVDEN